MLLLKKKVWNNFNYEIQYVIFCDLHEFWLIGLEAKITTELSNYITNTVNIVLENTIDIQN